MRSPAGSPVLGHSALRRRHIRRLAQFHRTVRRCSAGSLADLLRCPPTDDTGRRRPSHSAPVLPSGSRGRSGAHERFRSPTRRSGHCLGDKAIIRIGPTSAATDDRIRPDAGAGVRDRRVPPSDDEQACRVAPSSAAGAGVRGVLERVASLPLVAQSSTSDRTNVVATGLAGVAGAPTRSEWRAAPPDAGCP
jgi:hypothetical protein